MPENASGKSFPAAQFSGVLDYGQNGTMKNSAQETAGKVVAQGTGSIGNISSNSNRNTNHSMVNTSLSNININHSIVNTSNSNINIKSSNIINTANSSSNSYSSSLIFQTESELHQGGTNLQQEVGAFFTPV